MQNNQHHINKEIHTALRTIIDMYGVEVFASAARMNSLLMDLAPNSEKERKLLVLAMREGAARALLKVVEADEETQKRCIIKWRKRLVAEIWIAEDASVFVMNTLAAALGIHCEMPREQRTAQTVLQSAHKLAVAKGMYMGDDQNLVTFLSHFGVIGYKAFAANTALANVVIPDGITEIHSKAFQFCSNLVSVELPASVKKIGRRVFEGCNRLSSVTCKSKTYFQVVNGLLIDCKNKAVLRALHSLPEESCSIPNEITAIQSYAFENNPVKQVTLPKALETLETRAFFRCDQLESFGLHNQNDKFRVIGGVLHTRDGARLIRFPSGYPRSSYILEDSVTHIAPRAFGGTAQLVTITTTGNLLEVGDHAFEYCQSLESIMLAINVRTIGVYAFQYCEKLSTIILPRNMKEINDGAFAGCPSIEQISLPQAMESLGNFAFAYCTNLKKVMIHDHLSHIGDGAFAECGDSLVIHIRRNDYVETYCKMHGIEYTLVK